MNDVLLAGPPGTTLLDLGELEGLKFKHVTTRGQLDHLEQANIQNGLLWLSRTRRKDVLSESFVRELHKKLFGEVWQWAGLFRQREKNIGVDPLQIGVRLRTLLDDAGYWLEHKTYSAKEAAARLHHGLVYIHLFSNGNGRHARIMADALLTKVCKEKPINWSGGYDPREMHKRRSEYISALRKADGGNFRALLDFVGAG